MHSVNADLVQLILFATDNRDQYTDVLQVPVLLSIA